MGGTFIWHSPIEMRLYRHRRSGGPIQRNQQPSFLGPGQPPGCHNPTPKSRGFTSPTPCPHWSKREQGGCIRNAIPQPTLTKQMGATDSIRRMGLQPTSGLNPELHGYGNIPSRLAMCLGEHLRLQSVRPLMAPASPRWVFGFSHRPIARLTISKGWILSRGRWVSDSNSS